MSKKDPQKLIFPGDFFIFTKSFLGEAKNLTTLRIEKKTKMNKNNMIFT